jgi:hypothetical protein
VAHRPGTENLLGPTEVTVQLKDLEPVLGLVAAVGRLCAHLTPEAINTMPESAKRALAQIQTIMWNLEHSKPELDPGQKE